MFQKFMYLSYHRSKITHYLGANSLLNICLNGNCQGFCQTASSVVTLGDLFLFSYS